MQRLGAPFFPVPGIFSEKIYPFVVDVTGLPLEPAPGDGSPMEEGGALRWRSQASMEAALEDGSIQDAKTELAYYRFIRRGGPASSAPRPP